MPTAVSSKYCEPLQVVDIKDDVKDILDKKNSSPQDSPFDKANPSP
jgi:hypothetical protein